ncbi:hypothetical protein [uncultured Tateyamaria sp.]|uniref:hypothetical protein n=1 Tax=uncultured Tateyamaria sp. TaxID=455651 RepID=UPI0026036BDD|nr:hypothetical protein [uncultured Tateyamaria sp.]
MNQAAAAIFVLRARSENKRLPLWAQTGPPARLCKVHFCANCSLQARRTSKLKPGLFRLVRDAARLHGQLAGNPVKITQTDRAQG